MKLSILRGEPLFGHLTNFKLKRKKTVFSNIIKLKIKKLVRISMP